MAAGDVILASDFRMGMVARGRRTTATGNVTTTETGVLRLDSVPVFANRAYGILLSEVNMDTSVNNDTATTALRVSTSGTATTSSTKLAILRGAIDDAAVSNIWPMVGFFFPGADGTASFLMSIVRTSGTGNILIFCSATDYLDMAIIDFGPAPADTGVSL